MCPWEAVQDKQKYGVVITNYWEKGQHRLNLSVGDTVHILQEHEGWYYGYNNRNRNEKGIFPKAYVHHKESVLSRTGSFETVVPKEAPLVLEITTILREWSPILKNLYITSSRTVISNFENIWKTMTELIDWRRLILSSKLTMDEMRELQRKITTKIDIGNSILKLDLVVRDENGNVIDPAQSSTVSLFRQHQLATQRIMEEKEKTKSNRPVPKKSTSSNLYVNVKNFVCRIGENADVLISLYDAKAQEFICENYILQWGNQGMPRDLEMFNNLRVLFTDLGVKDQQRERIFLVCQIIRIGRMDLKESENKKQTRGIRRPFGVAAYDVTPIIKGALEPDEEKQYFVPFMQCGEKDNLDMLIKKAVTPKEVNHKGQGLWVTLKNLAGDLKQVHKDYPHIMSTLTAISRKMGFPDVIMPGDVRNDIYITLAQGEFHKAPTKTAERNIEVTMCVCNQKGDIIENVISEGAGGDMTSVYRSVVYYHENKPKWCETVKVAIPIDEFYGSHLKFTFKHRSSNDAKDKQEKPFAMSFVKLMQDNEVTIMDKDHELIVYKYASFSRSASFRHYRKSFENKKDEDTCSYLKKVPSTRQEFEALYAANPAMKTPLTSGCLTMTSDSFQISSLVCSTKLTHNVDLMGLLKWRDNPEGLKEHLLSFMKVDGEEVVKFLQDVLDALFNILMQNSDSDLYDNLVFDALIFIISLISDRKYHQFRPVLDVYIKENFSATLAYNKLMVVLKHYIETENESLLKSMKSLEYVFKFIIRSRVLFAALNEGRGKQQFEVSLKQLFTALCEMMKRPSDSALYVQGAALKYLPNTVDDMITVFDATQFSLILVEFINSVPTNRLVTPKLTFMSNIVHSSLFSLPECRQVILPMMCEHLRSHLQQTEEMELSASLMSDILSLLYSSNIGSTKDDISTVALYMLRTIIQNVITMDRKSPLIGSYVAVMTGILRQMTDYHYTQYINHFATRIDLTDFLMEIIMVFQDLVTHTVFPSDWNEMNMLQNSVYLKALRYFGGTIQERFTNPFEYQLWNNFFHCAISFLTQEALQLENFSMAKRAKIVSRYKDMRREMGFEIRSMWFNLGQHKISFIPDMVGPVLEMTLTPETELRKATIPIFFDMMQCEFMSSSSSGGRIVYKQNFKEVEHEMITQLDALVEHGRGDEAYSQLFSAIMMTLCESHSTMRKDGLVFVETIKELLQRLLEYRDVIHGENRDDKMSCSVNLLNFYHDIQRKELYIRYLHKLCDLHLECDNYTEAAYTFMLYAKLLLWSDDDLPTVLHDKDYEKSNTHRELKEQLYYTMIEYFDKGKMWEKCIELCKELAYQYESETFDYVQLSQILTKQSECYNRIMLQMRPEPEYFRVGYYGLGFPAFLQNKVFIYRGKEYERLSDFSARLQNQYPIAQMLKSLNAPGDDIQQSNGQYLLINNVTPLMEQNLKFTNKRVHDQIIKYYKVNEVQRFQYSKRKDESKGDDMTQMWLERTTLVTSYPLPGILQWFPVISSHTVEVSPIEVAIETMEKTNAKLKSLIDQHKIDSGLRVDPLGMVLNGVVDAAVNGGIAKYKFFYGEDYLKLNTHVKDKSLVKRLRQVTTVQMILLQKALDIHGSKAPESLQPFHAHMEQRFAQIKAFSEKEFNIKLSEDKTSSVKRIQTMPPQQRNSEMPAKAVEPTYTTSKILPAARMAQSVMMRVAPSGLSMSNNTANRDSTTSHASSSSKSSRESPTKVYTRMVSGSSPRGSISYEKESSPPPNIGSPNGGKTTPTSTPSKSRSGSIVILNEQLTPLRPLRPESDRRSKSYSGNYSAGKLSRLSTCSVNSNSSSNSSSSGTSSGVSNYNDLTPTPGVPDSEPPPLPEKQLYADYTNISPEEAMDIAARPSILRLGTHKNRPQPPTPSDESMLDEIPVIPPKKPGRSTYRENESDV